MQQVILFTLFTCNFVSLLVTCSTKLVGLVYDVMADMSAYFVCNLSKH